MVDLIVLLLSCGAAVLGIRAATVEVRDNVDEFINDLRRQGRWAAWAAVINAVAAIAAVGAKMWAIHLGA